MLQSAWEICLGIVLAELIMGIAAVFGAMILYAIIWIIDKIVDF